MNNIRNCKECGKIFQYDGMSKLCYRCRKEDDERYKAVRDYLYEFPKAPMAVVSEATEVPEETILRYLREGRLELAEGSTGLILDCERCGTAIRTGRFCNQCTVEIDRGMRAGFETPAKEMKRNRDRDKMFITELKKKNKK